MGGELISCINRSLIYDHNAHRPSPCITFGASYFLSSQSNSRASDKYLRSSRFRDILHFQRLSHSRESDKYLCAFRFGYMHHFQRLRVTLVRVTTPMCPSVSRHSLPWNCLLWFANEQFSILFSCEVPSHAREGPTLGRENRVIIVLLCWKRGQMVLDIVSKNSMYTSENIVSKSRCIYRDEKCSIYRVRKTYEQ